ncbi:hypothetical protein [Phnomibacter ginsenosidimutans]|uniref:Lipocalin-like domain-containing protein n=1 Tax=Phnomibacter ginsenosidimutans TaxID=2676868 RepID=A0A6I6G881_9BACT|nr:hypothetical protein [Phnomibacter ginsenosidimutans]QGW28916.1 hypothetical protein GLV81_13140 [Phnomibacter ginsenosidimutans]
MRVLLFIVVIITSISCNNSSSEKQIPNKTNRESIRQDIIGIWELFKRSYKPTEEPKLVEPNDKEYLEIKNDGTCQHGRYEAKWFLSYTDDFIIDSTSKVFFTELTYLSPNSWGEYDRTIKPYQIKVTTENNIKYLYITSLKSSDTRVYIRKN